MSWKDVPGSSACDSCELTVLWCCCHQTMAVWLLQSCSDTQHPSHISASHLISQPSSRKTKTLWWSLDQHESTVNDKWRGQTTPKTPENISAFIQVQVLFFFIALYTTVDQSAAQKWNTRDKKNTNKIGASQDVARTRSSQYTPCCHSVITLFQLSAFTSIIGRKGIILHRVC